MIKYKIILEVEDYYDNDDVVPYLTLEELQEIFNNADSNLIILKNQSSIVKYE